MVPAFVVQRAPIAKSFTPRSNLSSRRPCLERQVTVWPNVLGAGNRNETCMGLPCTANPFPTHPACTRTSSSTTMSSSGKSPMLDLALFATERTDILASSRSLQIQQLLPSGFLFRVALFTSSGGTQGFGQRPSVKKTRRLSLSIVKADTRKVGTLSSSFWETITLVQRVKTHGMEVKIVELSGCLQSSSRLCRRAP